MNAIARAPRPFVGLQSWRSATIVCVMGFAHYSRKAVLGGRVIPGVGRFVSGALPPGPLRPLSDFMRGAAPRMFA